MQTALKHNDVASRVRKLAQEHHVSYTAGPRDRLAHHITRLAGDDVSLDEVELLLVALQRAGVVSGKDAVLMHADYLRQRP